MATTLMDNIVSGENQKIALTFAFYNSIAFALLGLCLLGFFAIYQVLYMFLVPILWAVLIGTVLFPFKRHLSTSFKGWLDNLGSKERPLLIGIIILPLQVVKYASEYVYDTALSLTGFYCGIGYFILKILCFDDIFIRLLSWFGSFYSLVDLFVVFFTKTWVIISLISYTAAFVAWVCFQDVEKIHKKMARALSLPIWFFVIANISNFFGFFRVIIFALVIILLSLISLGIIGVDSENISSDVNENKSDYMVLADSNETNLNKSELKSLSEKSDFEKDYFAKSFSGDTHLRIIGGLCVLLWTLHYDIFLIFFLILFFIAIFIKCGERIGIFNILKHLIDVSWKSVEETVNKIVNIIVAGFLRKFVKLLFTSDRIFVSSLLNKVDLISSIVVMLALAIGSLVFFLFTIFQLHNEIVHLVKLGGNVVSSNPDWMKYALNYTEGQLKEHDIDDYIEQAYLHGRKWLASNVRSLADPSDMDRADQLENQINLLVDSLYRMWSERNNDMNSTTTTIYSSRSNSDWMIQLMSTSNLETLKGEIKNVITENIETVLSIMKSLWAVVLLNISILKTAVGSILSIILGFGFELMNFFIELIVFLTVVYYLLASSNEHWLPLRLVNEFALSSSFFTTTTISNYHFTNIAEAFEDAISGIFVLSAKMSLFYGFYTYFIHSLFDLNIVFVPSMLAGIFAAIPIMPSYIVSIFGIVEIFLVRGNTIAGIVFALSSIAPLFFADAAFYKEIKGSHPYVTGLAVIGGIYWMGLQGAIIGPIIFCCALALFNFYKEFGKS